MQLIEEIEDLSVYVEAHVSQYTTGEKDQRRIQREWAVVESRVAALKVQEEDGRRSSI